MNEKEAVYLFCFAGKEITDQTGLIAIESMETKFFVLHCDQVSAVYGFVPLDDFTGPGLEDRLRDLDWIGPRAFFHEKVIEEVFRRSPVYPAPFGTVYRSEESLSQYTRDHAGTISSFLRRVSGMSEWAVKGYLDSEKGRKALEQKVLEELADLPASPGARYLHEQRLRASFSDKYKDWLAEVLSEAREALSVFAEDFRSRTIFAESEAETGQEMVSNWALLVRGHEQDRLASAVSELNELHERDGFFFRLSGPWPPFSFAPPLDLVETGSTHADSETVQ